MEIHRKRNTHKTRKLDKQIYSNLTSINELLKPLMDKLTNNENNEIITKLWPKWDEVLGHELASLAKPLGHKNDQLIIGCDDSIILQELTMRQNEILDLINNFFSKKIFFRLKVQLTMKKRIIKKNIFKKNFQLSKITVKKQAKGIFLKDMDENLPITRCYKIFSQGNNKTF